MKKYFVLALALVVFAVAPVMADVAVSGEYNYSAAWNTGDEEFTGVADKVEMDVAASLDDYNTFKFEIEDDEKANAFAEGALSFTYAKVITDWGKYFGTADQGFGIETTVGTYEVETKDIVDFTGYGIEDVKSFVLPTEGAWQADFDVMGIVKPYVAMNFDTYAGDGAKYLLGALVEVAPVTAEIYYGCDGKVGAENASVFGTEAFFSSEVSDGVVANAGLAFFMEKSEYDEYDMGYGFGAGVEAYGATLNVSLAGAFLGSDAADAAGDPSLALSILGVDAAYDILEWLGVYGGMVMALGDGADYLAAGESFVGAEFGLNVKPGAAEYTLGYAVNSEDSGGAYADYAMVPNDLPANGGIFFAVDLDF